MVATSSIRTRVRDEIITRLNQHPALVTTAGDRVPVSPGRPGNEVEREHVFVARITGEREVAFLAAGRKTITDDFTITFIFMSAIPGEDIGANDERVEQMSNALLDVLADDPGLSDANGAPMDGLMWATEATTEGPDGELTDEGAVSFWRSDVECKARYE